MYSCSKFVRNLTRFIGTEPGNSISIYWQYAEPILTTISKWPKNKNYRIKMKWIGNKESQILRFDSMSNSIVNYLLPVHSSSILANCAFKQSFTHNSISCRDKFSDVTFVEYTFTAIVLMIVILLRLLLLFQFLWNM